MPFPFQALVFDLDGTLIDSAPDMTRVLNRTLAEFGRPALTEAQVRTMVGDGSAMLVRQAFAATGEPLGDEAVQPVLRHYLDTYYDDAEPPVLYADVAQTLAALAARGVRLGLCTNKPERITRKLLGIMGLEGLFGAVAGGDTLPVKKPDGRHLTWVLEQLDAQDGSARAAMIGDNGNDVKAARSAGVPVVAMSYGYPRMPVEELGADLILDRFADLPEGLMRLAFS
ncbi:phosphoglycolate phosphatase [Azospirillum lipoferum]|uniref:Phosphoglycolate phosphatase n=1 Tax=Azospirillum lipoferum TaxID=193 RepID=A0A5A9GNF7_AZOLI|nr:MULTISPECIES: HAD-IA family hydrolase [Azospirillum]KAA0594819.1 HAD-IA family hydrolase [Azospirillum lipoferum]MCP1612856.1 phosphoglycolate phosphatase [Azospirillum lipoferum]MDW5532005.1 HAD-IA family hydrolase [Azospirillum sp. NL1]